MNNTARYYIRIIFLGFGVIPFAASFLCSIPFFSGGAIYKILSFIFVLALIFILYFSSAAFLAVKWIEKEYPDSFAHRYTPVCLPLILTLAASAVCMVISKGFTGHEVFAALFIVEIAFLPMIFFISFAGYNEFIFIIPLIYKAAFLLFFILKERKTDNKPTPYKTYIAGFLSLVFVFAITIGWVQFSRRQTVLPKDYGFNYGGGFASVDIYRYDVTNSENILPILNKPSSFIIGNRNQMPVLDGAEAAYPVYSAFANACYAGIVEKTLYDYITFTNTIYAFERLVNGEVDIFFGAQPSKAQEELAQKNGKKLVLTPIGKEAFVFFVNNTNKCDNLTTQNIHDIYSGKVKNWMPITGANEKIYAFQRPENSGSQTIMQRIMGDIPLAEPLREEYVAGMGGVSESVADYRNYPGAIGYSFKFFTTGMADNSDMIKLLSIDGIAPTTESITSAAYPYTVSLYAITLEDNKLETVEPFLEWMQGAEGQELVEKIGYVPIK